MSIPCVNKIFIFDHFNSLHPSIKFTFEVQEDDKTIPFLDVLFTIHDDGSLGHNVYRKPTHTDRYLHYNSFHHPSIKNTAGNLHYN
jgi:hypothetical protein